MSYMIMYSHAGRIRAQSAATATEALTLAQAWRDQGEGQIRVQMPDGQTMPLDQFEMFVRSATSSV